MLLPEYGVSLERLTADHAAALLMFERENRAFFATSIADRGDAFFENFTEILQARLADDDCRFHVLVEADGAVVGRVNLVDIADGSAELGYRLAERVTGRGLATAAVRAIIRLAATEYGLHQLTAGAALANVGSWTVLERAGFHRVELPEAATEAGRTVEVRPQVAYVLRLEEL